MTDDVTGSEPDEGTSMEAEFDTVAAWTAEVVRGLDEDRWIPAGCRGSGSPGVLHWLLEHVGAGPGDTFLDCGGGMGGPAALAARETRASLLLTDPEAGACRAARSLYGLPTLRAGTALPLATASVDAGWSLGVLCTVEDQPAFLAEVRRVLRTGGRLGLVVYCRASPGPTRLPAPEGNDFPTVQRLDALLADASLRTVTSGWTDDFAELPRHWQETLDLVDAELERRHGDDPRWRTAQEQSGRMGALLDAGEVRGRTLVVEAS